VSLVGCASNSADGGFTQSQADAISAECGAPSEWLQVEGQHVAFAPPPDASLEATACVLDEIKNMGVAKIGFIGNEKASEVEGQ